MHLVIPMSGQGRRFRDAGFSEPKPLVPINGTPIIERLLKSFPDRWPTVFILAESHRNTKLTDSLEAIRPAGRQIFIPPNTLGPSFAASHAIDAIPSESPIFISYCDYGMQWDPTSFEQFVMKSNCDIALVSYRGFHPHYLNPQMYAYSRLQGNRVVEVKEKGCFTDNREQEYASTGGYYFRSAEIFKRAFRTQIKKGLTLNGEYYTSLTVEAILQDEPKTDVRIFEVDKFFQWGTPLDLAQYAYWERCYFDELKRDLNRGTVAQSLIPMAGEGSRFSALSRTSKPFLSVNGAPMFIESLKSLPESTRTVLVVKKDHRADVEKLMQEQKIEAKTVFQPAEPKGQAIACLGALSELDLDAELLVSACDHGIVTPSTTWDELRQDLNCDAAIFTISEFPGTERRPESYAYVRPNSLDFSPFPTVKSVSVKKPLSKQPMQDMLLVGSFWFRHARIMFDGINALVASKLTVNGEYYLDSIFEHLIAGGSRIKMVPLNGYFCWGDPDCLAEAEYWRDVFMGRSSRIRPRFMA